MACGGLLMFNAPVISAKYQQRLGTFRAMVWRGIWLHDVSLVM